MQWSGQTIEFAQEMCYHKGMIRLVKKYFYGYRKEGLLGPLFKIFEAVFELIIPTVIAVIIDYGIANGDTKYIVTRIFIMIGLYITGYLCSLVTQWFAARAAYGFGENLRKAMFDRIMHMSLADIDRFGSSSLVMRMTGDINAVTNGVNRFIRLATRAPFLIIGSIIMAVRISPRISLVFIAAGVIVVTVLWLIMHFSVPRYSAMQRDMDSMSTIARENLSGVRVIRAFAATKQRMDLLTQANAQLSRSARKVGAVSSLLSPLTYMVVNTAIILVLWLGGKTVYMGGLSQGNIIELINYLTQILNALVVFANVLVVVTKACASAVRVVEVIECPQSMIEGKGVELDETAPLVEITNATYTYPNTSSPAIRGADLMLESGKTVGIIGSTGSGKSTLLGLISRAYDADSGVVRLCGVDVRDMTYAQIRSVAAVIPQRARLIRGSIRDNMLFAKPDADDESILRALDIAQASDFVLPLGLDYTIEAGGKNLSGGQRQRLTIARAILTGAKVLILDDSFSALDTETDRLLRHRLSKEGFSMIMVASRVTTLINVDCIIVMEEGRIVGRGKHSELVHNCEVYREICRSQDVGGYECE